MMAQKDFLAYCIIRKKCLIYGILGIIILIRHTVTLPEDGVIFLIQQDHRTELLGISHEHQVLSTQDRHQRHRCITLARLVHDGHVKIRLRRSQLMRGNTRRGDDRKYPQKPFQALLIPDILIERFYLFILIFHLQYIPQIFILWLRHSFQITNGSKMQVFPEFLSVIIQQRQRLLIGDLSNRIKLPVYFRKLPSLQIRLKCQMAVCVHQTLDRLFLLPEVQGLLIFPQKFREPFCPGSLLIPVLVQSTLEYFPFSEVFIQLSHFL